MRTLEKMHRHPRLYRHGEVYYHRATVPADIAATHPKTDETFSLRTKVNADAFRKVRFAAVEVNQRFDATYVCSKPKGRKLS